LSTLTHLIPSARRIEPDPNSHRTLYSSPQLIPRHNQPFCNAVPVAPLLPSTSHFHFEHPLWLNRNTNTLRRRNHTLRDAFQTQPTEPQFTLLNLCNLVDMLQTDRFAHSVRALIPSLQLPFRRLDLSSAQEQERGCWCADLEMETSIWTDGHTDWGWGSRNHVRCSSIEFLSDQIR
jgi:hypothetical protein